MYENNVNPLDPEMKDASHSYSGRKEQHTVLSAPAPWETGPDMGEPAPQPEPTAAPAAPAAPAAESAARIEKRTGWGKRIAALVLCGLLFGAAAGVGLWGVNRLLKGNASAETAAAPAERTAAEAAAAPAEHTAAEAAAAPAERTAAEAAAAPAEHTAAEAAAAPKESKAAPIAAVTYSADTDTPAMTLDVSDIAEDMMPAMVSITNISVQEVQSYYGMFGRGQSRLQESQSSGTGIILGENDSELLIVTNNHVVEDATTLSVCFVDNEVCEATVKGTDPDNDLAVIAVKKSDVPKETAKVIRAAVIGSSDELKVGQQVVAIGNALGYGQSVTTGIVSALNRQIDTTDGIMIQTDAAINPGNSGGALLNLRGEVVGINSAKFSSTEVEGMGYAISITTAMPIIEDLMNRTTREKVPEEDASWLGINGEDITSSISAAYGIPQGIYVTSVYSDSPARTAGITANMILTHFDGIRVTSLSNLENRLQYYAAGECVEVTFQVLEGNEYVEKTAEITLSRASEHQNSGGWGGGYWPGGRP